MTLGGLIGGEDATAPSDTPPPADTANGRLLSPADRFFTPPGESDGAAGRMVDRMRGMVGGSDVAENEFGLPELGVSGPTARPPSAVVTPPTPQEQAPLDLDPLAPPPSTDSVADLGLEVPGLVAPAPRDGPALPPTSPLDIPGLAAPPSGAVEPPSVDLPDLGIPGLPEPVPGQDLPDLGIPGLAQPAPAGDLPEGIEIPGAPSDLDIPGLSPIDPGPALADEVPGIIPPPSDGIADIPGLEALPGSTTGQLRRPGGLIEPDDPSLLPPPGSTALQERLDRLDQILNREPAQVRNRFGGRTPPVDTQLPPVATAPERPPVSREAVGPPGASIPSGVEGLAPRDPEQILRETRERRAAEARMGRVLEQPAAPQPDTRLRPSPHSLQPPVKGVTTRDEPASRLADRLSQMTERQYQDEDIYGLPIVRPSVDGRSPPRRDIDVTELQETRRATVDQRIHALARFFRGDQEEEQGMQPPDRPVTSEPLPRVIDNLLPENDPARGRVVDDRLLDLSGVETQPPSPGGASGTQLNENFLDRLTSVLGPSRDAPRAAQDLPSGPGLDLGDLDVPDDQIVPKPRPQLPDPWTMTVERSGPGGGEQTLGVTAISPNDGSEIPSDQGAVQSMIGRIRQMLVGPEDTGARVTDLDQLDEAERQQAAEDLLSEALRDGAPMALPDASQWSVTEIESASAPPGVPPPPRPGALTRTSLQDVILSIGESVTLENTLPPVQDGLDPLNECIKKNRGTTLFCVEPVDWPDNLRTAFSVPTILYTGPMAITRYDQGTPSRFHALFDSNQFEQIVAYFQARYGEPTEIWKRSIAPLAKPRMDNPTIAWRSRSSRSNVITVLEIRKFDDSRGGFPDTTRGAVMLYHQNAASIFPQVSSHELMRLRRIR